MICQREGGEREEGRNCQQPTEAAWGERPEERLSHRPWSVRKLNTVGERWSTACINNFLSPDRLPWRGQTTWRLCGSSRGSSCWRSDWQEGLVLYVWTSPLLQRPPCSLLWAPAWCCFLRFGRRSCQQDWTCGTSEGWTSDLSYLIWRIQNGEMHWAPLYSPLQAWRSVLCWNFPNLNATDQVAPDEDYRWTGPIFLPLLSFCCSCRLLQFMWPPPSSLPLHSVGAGMPPCSPQSCHREQFQMFLKPARACAGVKWEKMAWGGLLFLEDQDSQISQRQSYSMSFCLYQDSGAPVYLLSCVFNPGAPWGES